jgi:hypothetical protein
MISLRKEHAGSCNLGYTWPEDGSVVEVTPEHAQLLLAVPDGDFTAVAPDLSGEPGPELADLPAGDAVTQIEEPAPEAPISEAPAPRKAAAKKSAAKKAAATPEQAPVEE